MELLGKIQDIQSYCKNKPSKQSLMIAAEAAIEFFEEVTAHLPIELTNFIYNEIGAIYNIKRAYLKQELTK